MGFFSFISNLFNKKKRLENQIKDVLYKKDKHCHYCSEKLHRSDCTLDHVTPKSKGGPTTVGNSVLACKKCNTLKGDVDYFDFKSIIKNVEQREFYWKKYEKKINDNIIIDIVYPHLSEKINEYQLRLKILEQNKNQLLRVYDKSHLRIKNINEKKSNIQKEIRILRKKKKEYKKDIVEFEERKVI